MWEVVIKQLNTYSAWYAPIFTSDYVKSLSAYYEKLKDVNITDKNAEEIYNQLNKAMEVIAQADNKENINFSYMDQAKEMLAHYQEFLALAPAGIKDDFAFRILTGTTTPEKYEITYGNAAERYLPSVQAELQELTDSFELEAYYTFYEGTWGNLNNLWTGLANAIEKEALDKSAEIDEYGYEGSEKAEYERAVAVFQAALEDREYAQLVTEAENMQTALQQYTTAAENMMKEAKDQLPGLQNQLMALMGELERNESYYLPEYYQEVAAQISEVAEALDNLSALSDAEALKLVNSVKGTLKKQASSYSQKLDFLMKECESLDKAIADMFAYAADDVKETDTYEEAAALWQVFAEKLDREREAYDAGTVVDITGLSQAYDTLAADASMEDGLIQTTAKAILDAAVKEAQEIYEQESVKEHEKAVLEAYKAALDAAVKLQSEWDPTSLSSTLKALADAQKILLNDKADAEDPSDNPQKPSDSKQDPVNTDKKADGKKDTASDDVPKTGDAATAGVLAVMAVSGIGGAVSLRRRKKD